MPWKGGYPSQLLTKIPKITSNFPKKISSGVFTCSILASIVTILESIVVILTSIDPILEKCIINFKSQFQSNDLPQALKYIKIASKLTSIVTILANIGLADVFQVC